jgi:hypothetical protein
MAALPPNWREATDPESGATYWYNEVSGESTWDRPPPPRQGSSAPRAGAGHGGFENTRDGWDAGCECNKCGKTFNSKRALNQHQNATGHGGANADFYTHTHTHTHRLHEHRHRETSSYLGLGHSGDLRYALIADA